MASLSGIKKNKTFSCLPLWKIQTHLHKNKTGGFGGGFSGDKRKLRERWIQTMYRSTYIYAGPDRYINTHTENTIVWCFCACLWALRTVCARVGGWIHAQCEAAATRCMHEGRLLRDRSMSSCAGVESAIAPRDADYRLFREGGGRNRVWAAGLILMAVMTKSSRLQVQ